jgi:hypothetical protein
MLYGELFGAVSLISFCDLNPNNPEDANLIVNLLKGAEQLNAAMTKYVSIITDIRDYALSSGSTLAVNHSRYIWPETTNSGG